MTVKNPKQSVQKHLDVLASAKAFLSSEAFWGLNHTSLIRAAQHSTVLDDIDHGHEGGSLVPFVLSIRGTIPIYTNLHCTVLFSKSMQPQSKTINMLKSSQVCAFQGVAIAIWLDLERYGGIFHRRRDDWQTLPIRPVSRTACVWLCKPAMSKESNLI